jgi:hypothetical protein
MKSHESKRASIILHSFNLVLVNLPKDNWLRNFTNKNIFLVSFLLLNYLNINILKKYIIFENRWGESEKTEIHLQAVPPEWC